MRGDGHDEGFLGSHVLMPTGGGSRKNDEYEYIYIYMCVHHEVVSYGSSLKNMDSSVLILHRLLSSIIGLAYVQTLAVKWL